LGRLVEPAEQRISEATDTGIQLDLRELVDD
jgi:hypothetical protein